MELCDNATTDVYNLKIFLQFELKAELYRCIPTFRGKSLDNFKD